jgi:hypothetical protein
MRALRADSVKIYTVSDYLKVPLGTLGQSEIEFAEDINDLLAGEADEVMVGFRVGIKSFLVRIDGQFADKPLFPQHLQRVVYGGEGHHGKTVGKGAVNLGGRRVGQVPFQIVKDGEPLRGNLYIHFAKFSFCRRTLHQV